MNTNLKPRRRIEHYCGPKPKTERQAKKYWQGVEQDGQLRILFTAGEQIVLICSNKFPAFNEERYSKADFSRISGLSVPIVNRLIALFKQCEDVSTKKERTQFIRSYGAEKLNRLYTAFQKTQEAIA